MVPSQADNKSTIMDYLPKLAGCCTDLSVDLQAKAFDQNASMGSDISAGTDVFKGKYDALKAKYDALKGKYDALKDQPDAALHHDVPIVHDAAKGSHAPKTHGHGDHAEVTCASRTPEYNLDRLMRPPTSEPFKYNPSNRGEAATVFVIDSGINEGHEEFRRNNKGIVKVLGKYLLRC